MRTTLALTLFIVTFHISKTEETRDVADYKSNEFDGHAYRIMYKAETWQKAKETCEMEGAKLAVPKSKEQFDFLQQMVRNMHYPNIMGTKYRYLVFLGISNLEDYKVWKNVDGEDIDTTGFHKWSTNYHLEARPNPAEPHCVGIDAINDGLREFWCHLAQPYICEKEIKKA